MGAVISARVAAGAALVAALAMQPDRPAAQPHEVAPPESDYDDKDERKSDFWERALDPEGEKVDGLVERAVALMREGDRESLKQAAEILAKAIELAPDRPRAHLWLGRLAEREGDFTTCVQSIAKALDIDPGLDAPGGSEPSEWAAQFELAVCNARNGKFEAAVEGLRRIQGRAQGQQPIVYQRLGECYMALGRLDEAVESFRQGLRLSPYVSELGFALAVAHDRDGDAAEARDALAQALARDSRFSSLTGPSRIWIPAHDAHYYIGLAALGGEDWARATLHFRRYLAAAGETAWAPRARVRYEEALANATAGKGLEVRGSATLDQARTTAVIARADGALQACLRKAPDLLLRVSITRVLPSKGKTPAPAAPAGSRPGVRVLLQEQSGTKAADLRTVVTCAEAVARKIAVPKPGGAPGTYATVEFNVIAR